ncbi:PPOX class F420-dependent oxidoreductase [uncultured Jatrophihabitans sp.]|uniref:PPOX class F420-dependent oxidoreductase n=1 Tax=uncultured Jatrophihabitans sp. TaxID=1610747 RepID=UPI0035C992BB
MDADEARTFLRSNHRAVLATVRQDGRPAMSPVVAAVDGQGRVVVSTRETAMKVKHVRRDPHVSMCAFGDGFFGQWVQVEGTAEIVELPEAMDLLVAYYRDISGEHPDWDDYRAAMQRERRVVIRFAIERAGPNVSG